MKTPDLLPAACCRRLRCAVATAGAVAALLAGCGSPPQTRFHSLMPPPSPGTVPSAPAGAVAWEVLPVAIPAQVDQPQWVVRSADGSLAVLEQERWIAPLAGEIRAAVAERLTQLLGAPAATASAGKLWRVAIDVQRFDAAPGREVRLEATWTVSSPGEPAAALRCRGEFAPAVPSGGYLALAQAHRQGVAKLAEAIGAALQALSQGQPARCDGQALG